MSGIGVYPGSFNPPTIAHLAIAQAARDQGDLERVVLAVSRMALGKEELLGPRLEDRVAVLEAIAARLGWLGVVLTDQQLIADVSAGYDAVIVGADKWAQIVDPVWYESVESRDTAVARLPRLLLAPRYDSAEAATAGLPKLLVAPRHPLSPEGMAVLELPPAHLEVSSTAVRAGRREWMAPEAAAFDDETGAWSDPARYARWLTRNHKA